jgi:hypothetical protein
MKEEEDIASYDENNRDIIGFFNVYRVKMILLLFVVILIYVVIFSLLNNASTANPERKPYIFVIEIVLWAVLIAVIVLNVRYYNDKDFSFDQMFKNLFSEKIPQIDVNVHKGKDYIEEDGDKGNGGRSNGGGSNGGRRSDGGSNGGSNGGRSDGGRTNDDYRDYPKRATGEKRKDEVFHLRKNIFNYSEAKEACGLLDSRLATYDEIENAYSNGANWCSYGWSDDQMVLFPTQKEYFNQLKQFPGHEHDCGRVGINGGYVKNKYAKFGVNCYGKKPYATEKDREYLSKYKLSGSVPDDMLKKLREEKQKDFLVTPFNKDKWSAIG